MKTTTNLTVSHLSPLISYVPGMLWSDGGEDPLKDSYQGRGYHSTNSSFGEGRLFFTWYGEDVWVFGGYRTRLGAYNVTIDGKHHRHCGGFREGDDETADAVLFNSTDFKLGLANHVMEIVNVGHDGHKNDSVFDINRIVYEHPAKHMANISSSDPKCQWSTSGNASSPIWYQTNDSMTTYSSSASMSISFSGKAIMRSEVLLNDLITDIGTGIALYGAVAPNSSPFLVTIDNELQVLHPNPQSNSSALDPQLLFVSDGIPPGDHQLSVWNSPALSLHENAPTTLNIHHALTFESSDHQPPPPDSQQDISIVGIVITAVSILLLIILALLIWFTRRRRIRAKKKYTPQPFKLKSPSTPPTRRRASILPLRISAAFSRITTRSQSHTYDSLIGTQGTPRSEMLEYMEACEFSPTTTVCQQSRRNTAQLVLSKSIAYSMRATIHHVDEAEIPPVPLVPPPLPPPMAAGQGHGPRPADKGSGGPSTSRTL